MTWLLPTITIALVGLGALHVAVSGHIVDRAAWRRVLCAALAVMVLALAFAPESATWSFHWAALDDMVGLAPRGAGVVLATQCLLLLVVTLLPCRTGAGQSSHRLWPTIAVWMMAAMLLAFTVDHFLARVIALDMAALGALALLAEDELVSGRRSALLRSFMALRLGDMGLLMLVLVLWLETGTWDIGQSLQSAATMTGWPLTWAVVGGLVSVGAKMAMPPLADWKRAALALGDARAEWLTAGGLPLLGAYLLYRLQPLIDASGATIWVRGLGALYLTVSVSTACIAMRRGRPSIFSWLVAHSAVAWLLPVGAWAYIYLYSFMPLRWACLHYGPGVPQPILEALRDWGRLAQIGDWLDQSVEHGGLTAMIQLPVRIALWLSRALQSLHTGILRRNLAWTVLLLLVLVLFTLFGMGG